MKNFDPVKVEDLAVHNKKIQEVEDWLKNAMRNSSDVLLLSGPVGCGKTATIQTLATKLGIKITEWITPVDIELPTDYGKMNQTMWLFLRYCTVTNLTSNLYYYRESLD